MMVGEELKVLSGGLIGVWLIGGLMDVWLNGGLREGWLSGWLREVWLSGWLREVWLSGWLLPNHSEELVVSRPLWKMSKRSSPGKSFRKS